MFTNIDLKELEKKKNNLDKKDIDLIICDFDDTIFSTKEFLEDNVRKGRRGNEGNQYIKEVVGIKKFIDTYYLNKDFPKKISSKLREGHDLILTAGYNELQIEKIKACNLNHINYKIVYNSEEKILETIKYIVEELKFIPSKVTVFEDRPKYFIEYKDFLEDFLGTQLEIMYVEMKDNYSTPTIKKLED